MEINGLTWGLTIALIVGLLAFDYFAHVRKAHTPSIREAAIWSGVYVGLALVFGLVFFAFGDTCLLYTSPSPRDVEESRMPSSA